MRFQIIARQTEDWGNLNFEEWVKSYENKFGNLRWLTDQQIQQFKDNVVEWNRKYVPNYFQYRAALHDIAKKTWNATGIEVASIDGWSNFEDEDLILIPTDDDDWFHPDIAAHLEKVFEDKSVQRVVWKAWLWYKDGTFLQRELPETTSNGYALRASRASYYYLFSKELMLKFWNPETSKMLDEGLSVYLRHRASFTSMHRQPLDEIPRKPDLPHPKELEWCRGSIESVRELSRLSSGKLYI